MKTEAQLLVEQKVKFKVYASHTQSISAEEPRLLLVEMMRYSHGKRQRNQTFTLIIKMLNFCDSKTACQILKCCARTLLRYRQQNKLFEGIHWGRNPSGKVLYNSVLLNQLISCNGDINHPDHQKFMERYLSDRPENQPQKPGRKRATDLVVLAG
jgi:hypothetical protein